MHKDIIRQLTIIVGPNNISTAQAELSCVSYDGTGQTSMPEAVIWPSTADEVSRVMAIAHRQMIPVVARGAGSGMTGGAIPTHGGLVIAMARFNHILEIDQENQTAIVEPGVVTGTLQAEVGRYGLFYPPDPASAKFCTIGGNVAEGAGGPSAVKYGVTRDYVKGLEVVLADGRIIHTGVRTDKGVVGYDLTRLFVGSEGTLGIITKIILRLIPKPKTKQTTLVLLDSMLAATRLVAQVLSNFSPCTLEFMDRTAISIVADKLPMTLSAGTEALLLIELDGSAVAVASEGTDLARFLFEQSGVRQVTQAKDKSEVDRLWLARRSVSPAAFSLRTHKLGEDVVVPRTAIPDLVAYAEELARELKLILFCFGHAGDGNIHINIMYNQADDRQMTAAHIAKKRIFTKVIALGGTLSGEHGVGITKSAYLPLEVDQNTIAAMKLIKLALDPGNILNPGKIFP
ncbi:MAG: FAD-binding protein [Proteobacteria bacterium]|nr:FAD-binding protein [Desulfobulbaceae bacterium]MBU4152545.1 FAD-binding protein [Pseudomonadota bacterium]